LTSIAPISGSSLTRYCKPTRITWRPIRNQLSALMAMPMNAARPTLISVSA
jgi:hypothetical protein